MTPYLCLLGAAFLWGTSFVAGKFAMGVADAPLIVLFRFLMASLFWLPTFIQASKSLPKARWGKLITLSFLMIPATFLLQFIGLQYTTAASAAVMIGFEPLMIVLIGWLLWGEKLTGLNLAFGVMAMLGVMLVMGWPEGARFFGCALVLISTAVVAIWVRWSKSWMDTMSVNAFTSLITIVGTVLLIPCALLLTKNWQIEWSMTGFIALLYLGIGCSLSAGWLWNMGLKRTPANAGGLFLALEPIFGVMGAALLLSEPFGLIATTGTLLVVLPVVISSVIPLIRPYQSSRNNPN